MERSAAITLLSRYVHEHGLTKHCLATGAVMNDVLGLVPKNPKA